MPALDLGWCVIRPLTAEQSQRVLRASPKTRHRFMLAAFAGIRTRAFAQLPAEKQRDLHFGAMWMTYPFGQPRAGRIVPTDA